MILFNGNAIYLLTYITKKIVSFSIYILLFSPLQIIATQRGNSKRFPMNHNQNLQASRKFLRGHSSSLHSTSGINICYWNDANTVCVVDNDFSAGNTDFVERLQGNVLRCPESIRLYQEIYGWVDKTNQQLSYYLTKSRSRRKQTHLLFTIIEIYALCKMHTFWCNI